VLLAFCRAREGWRTFYLSRISAVRDTDDSFFRRPEAEWAHRIQGAYGIFQGADHIPVALRFNPYRARWVREQRWHPDQKLTERHDGGVDLSFPVADLREIKLKVLSFGADVEVLTPEKLRRQVVEEIEKMAHVYRQGEKGGT